MSTLGKRKEVSSCCGAKVRVNMVARAVEGAMQFYFCSKCGTPCDVAMEKGKFGSTLSTVRKPTGERQLFVELYAKCGGKSQVSGDPLLPPAHPQFHFQGSHILSTNRYPDYHLDPRNIIMITTDEHALWTNKGPEGLRYTFQWEKWVKVFDRLKNEAETKPLARA